MLTILISLLVGLVAAIPGYVWLDSTIYAGISFAVGFIVPTVLLNLRIKKQMEAIFNDIQNDIQQSQQNIQQKIGQLQNKNVGSSKGLQKQFEKQQVDAIRDALKKLDQTQKFYRWNFLARKQSDTFRAQMLFQIKEFEKADQYFKNSFNADAMTVAMKMARAYQREEMKTVEKLYKKGKRRFRKDKGTILYAVYSWILVQQERIDDAISVLAEGKKKTENEVLSQNWDHLVNGRMKQFSNTGLGESWYALHLEKPKQGKGKKRAKKRKAR